MKRPIYLDYHATTPVDPRVLEVMLPWFTEQFGNAISLTHSFGIQADAVVRVSRENIAQAIGAQPNEIVFTSGATESTNLAVKGVAHRYREYGNHIITSSIEHKAVLEPCKTLEEEGFSITRLPVNREGFINLDELADAITEKTILVSIMHANNEIGTIQDIKSIGEICRARGVLFHTDGTQAIGKLPFDVNTLNVDLASFSSHKMYGPKGSGGLYIRSSSPRAHLKSQICGAGHEQGLRSGTLNVPGIVGMAKALEIAVAEMEQETKHCSSLRNMLLQGLQSGIDDVHVNGPDPLSFPEKRLPGNLNVSFPGVESDPLMMSIRDVAVSTSSACSTGSLQASHVLQALGLEPALLNSSIRFGIGRFTTTEEIEYAIQRFTETVNSLKKTQTIGV